MGKTLYGIFPAWWSWQAALNFSHTSIRFQPDSNILIPSAAGRSNCLLKCISASVAFLRVRRININIKYVKEQSKKFSMCSATEN